jgi:microcystin-dependent protein
MPKVRRQYSGGAVATTIDGPVGASLVNTFNVVGGVTPAGWPSSNGVPFFVVLSPQTSVEEKMLVTISGATLTIVSRALDGTSAGSHASGASIYPVFTATDADEANELTAKYATQGSIVYQGASTFTELTIGTASHVLRVNSGLPQWGQVGTDGIADSAVTSAKIANGTIVEGDLADGAVTSAKILDGTIVLGDLATALQRFLVPVGTIAMYGGASAPTGWLLCDGTSTSGYTALAAIVGATTPDLKGRFAIGDNSTLTLLGTGGSTTIAEANLPSHTHSIAHDHEATQTGGQSRSHGHVYTNNVFGTSLIVSPSDTGGPYLAGQPSDTTGDANQDHEHTFNVPAFTGNSGVGSGSGTAYYQPYLVVNYIIKHD